MGLIYDDPKLPALTLTRIAAEESEGPTELTGRMHALPRRSGPAQRSLTTWRCWLVALKETSTALVPHPH